LKLPELQCSSRAEPSTAVEGQQASRVKPQATLAVPPSRKGKQQLGNQTQSVPCLKPPAKCRQKQPTGTKQAVSEAEQTAQETPKT